MNTCLLRYLANDMKILQFIERISIQQKIGMVLCVASRGKTLDTRLEAAYHTGCTIKNWTHSFNHTCSHGRNAFNFKSTFICYYTELSFEVYNFFLSQQA